MKVPRLDSLAKVIDEISSNDYEANDVHTNSVVEYDDPVDSGINREVFNNLMKRNYVEPNKKLQGIYESQFRSFSRQNENSSFDNLI